MFNKAMTRAEPTSPTVDGSEVPLEEFRRALDSEIVLVAEALCKKMQTLGESVESRSAYKLFRHLDSDGSGKLGWDEFLAMVRKELKIGMSDLPNPRLRAVWLAFDVDSSGQISAGELTDFMRRGAGLQRMAGGAPQMQPMMQPMVAPGGAYGGAYNVYTDQL